MFAEVLAEKPRLSVLKRSWGSCSVMVWATQTDLPVPDYERPRAVRQQRLYHVRQLRGARRRHDDLREFRAFGHLERAQSVDPVDPLGLFGDVAPVLDVSGCRQRRHGEVAVVAALFKVGLLPAADGQRVDHAGILGFEDFHVCDKVALKVGIPLPARLVGRDAHGPVEGEDKAGLDLLPPLAGVSVVHALLPAGDGLP